MVKLNKIYTRTGDAGTTALGSGARVPKHSLRIAAYGTIDETNAAIGVCRTALTDNDRHIDDMLSRIQNDLFDLGADLCVPPSDAKSDHEPLRVSQSQVDRIEAEIDEMNSELEALKSFVLPGGSSAAAHLHVARTISRRAERLMTELAAKSDETISDISLKYVNRLSDFLFVASRYVNEKGKSDVLWVPGQNR